MPTALTYKGCNQAVLGREGEGGKKKGKEREERGERDTQRQTDRRLDRDKIFL